MPWFGYDLHESIAVSAFLLFACRSDIWKDGFFGDCELEHKWRWLVAEEERLVELRTAVTCRSEELEERLSTVEKREMALETLLSQTDIDKGYVNCDTGLRIRKDTDSCDKVRLGISFIRI